MQSILWKKHLPITADASVRLDHEARWYYDALHILTSPRKCAAVVSTTTTTTATATTTTTTAAAAATTATINTSTITVWLTSTKRGQTMETLHQITSKRASKQANERIMSLSNM